MLNLCELIQLASVPLGDFKIHLATSNSHPPLDSFVAGNFKQWQEYQNQKNFECEKILSLIRISESHWLFAGVWEVHGVTPKTKAGKSWFAYKTTEDQRLAHLTGRVIVFFKRDFRQSYLRGENYASRLIVAEILRERYATADFPGFSKVLLSFDDLKNIISREITSWRSALQSVAGVYVISDRSDGQLYVGSAFGAEGIWGRWKDYSKGIHGENIELRVLIQSKGIGHARHFQFSILEICDVLTSKEDVQRREVHWKKVLLSRSFGYNSN
jgi:hypothetical protein